MKKTMIEREREKFGARLRLALEQAGHKSTSPTELQRQLHLLGLEVTVCGARKWLLGEAIPTQDKLTKIAQWLGKAPDWLRFGTGDGATAVPLGQPIESRTLRMLHGFEKLAARDQLLVQGIIDNMLQTRA